MKLVEAVLSKIKMAVATIGLGKDSVQDNTQHGWPLTAPSLAPRMSKAMLTASNGLDRASASKVLMFLG